MAVKSIVYIENSIKEICMVTKIVVVFTDCHMTMFRLIYIAAFAGTTIHNLYYIE